MPRFLLAALLAILRRKLIFISKITNTSYRAKRNALAKAWGNVDKR